MNGRVDTSKYQEIYYKEISDSKDIPGNVATVEYRKRDILFITKEKFGYCVWKNTIWNNHYGTFCSEYLSELKGIFTGKFGDGASVEAVRYINNY